jgi:3-hydroxyacyl-[acyl-carrier-protein] dehydratase
MSDVRKMSRISRELLDSMVSFSPDDDCVSGEFLFREDFIGFSGHFPDQKVLPGICQIQCIQVLLGRLKNRPATLREIIKAKFLQPVLPDEKIRCACRDMTESDGAWKIKAVITRGDEKISDIWLEVAFD